MLLKTRTYYTWKKSTKSYFNIGQNSSFDSQINLGFKHIKPVIKKEKFFEDYLKEDQPKKEKDTISKPILIRSLRRPKLNVPNFPSFFYK